MGVLPTVKDDKGEVRLVEFGEGILSEITVVKDPNVCRRAKPFAWRRNSSCKSCIACPVFARRGHAEVAVRLM